MILDQGFEENASLANNVCNVCLLLCLCKLLHPTDEAIIPYEFHVPESCVHQVCIRLMCMHINFSTSRNYALHNVPYMTLKNTSFLENTPKPTSGQGFKPILCPLAACVSTISLYAPYAHTKSFPWEWPHCNSHVHTVLYIYWLLTIVAGPL